jgi:hypothetical protein
VGMVPVAMVFLRGSGKKRRKRRKKKEKKSKKKNRLV